MNNFSSFFVLGSAKAIVSSPNFVVRFSLGEVGVSVGKHCGIYASSNSGTFIIVVYVLLCLSLLFYSLFFGDDSSCLPIFFVCIVVFIFTLCLKDLRITGFIGF